MRAPDLLEPIVGWRVWAVETDPEHGLALMSLYFPVRWRPGGYSVAGCRDPRRLSQVPHDDPCKCGFHAAKVWTGAVPFFPRHVRLDHPEFMKRPTACVLGKVSLSGTVVEHERGYRAEKAKPAALFVPHLFRLPTQPVYALDAARRLADLYDVETRIVRRFDETELEVAA